MSAQGNGMAPIHHCLIRENGSEGLCVLAMFNVTELEKHIPARPVAFTERQRLTGLKHEK